MPRSEELTSLNFEVESEAQKTKARARLASAE
jgi:hypothetical protein